MDTDTLIYISAVYLIAGFVKGFSGLGLSAISIGIRTTFLDLAVAIPLVVIPSTASSLLVMIEAGGFKSALRKFWAWLNVCFRPKADGQAKAAECLL